MSKFNQPQYVEKYQKENLVRVVVKLNRKTDQHLLEHLEKQPNKQGYIKRLIANDIKTKSRT